MFIAHLIHKEVNLGRFVQKDGYQTCRKGRFEPGSFVHVCNYLVLYLSAYMIYIYNYIYNMIYISILIHAEYMYPFQARDFESARIKLGASP